jgi:hypothetical protein
VHLGEKMERNFLKQPFFKIIKYSSTVLKKKVVIYIDTKLSPAYAQKLGGKQQKKLPLAILLQKKCACGTSGFCGTQYESLIGRSGVGYVRLLLANPTQSSVNNIGSYHVDIWRELGRRVLHTEF